MGVARIFQRGVTEATHRCSPSCISGLSCIIVALRPILAKDKSRCEILYKKTNFKKVGFWTMAFTAKIWSWRFRHLDIVGCLLKRRPTGGGGGHGHPRTPPSYAAVTGHSRHRWGCSGGSTLFTSMRPRFVSREWRLLSIYHRGFRCLQFIHVLNVDRRVIGSWWRRIFLAYT